jgi:uncharacterized membrane protein YhaH (DUF805 family)
MPRVWLGEVGGGRVGRIGFLLREALLLAAFLALAFGLGLGFGLRNVLAVFLPLAALVGFAGLNLAAKRARDIGLPGWPLALGLALGLAAVLWLLPAAVALLAAAAAVVALATLPAGSAHRRPARGGKG